MPIDTPEQALVTYRHALRSALAKVDVPSNPGWSDEQVIDAVVLEMTGQPVQWLVCEKCQRRLPGEGSLVIHKMGHENETPSVERKDPLDVMREHVLAAKKFGYREMPMQAIVNMIELAKRGTLGEFKSEF